MGNEYKEQGPTWPSIQYKASSTLPHNLNKKKIHNYNDTDNARHNKFLTLPKKKNNKPLSEVYEPQNKDIKTLALREAGDKVESPLLISRKEHDKHFATWNGKSLDKDELDQLKNYVDNYSITALCIMFIRPIDYKNALKPLFEGVVSKSKTINNLCININPIAAPELTSTYFNKLLSCAIKKLHKSEGQYLKNISIGSDTIKPIDRMTFEKTFKAIYEVNKNTHLKSETHCLKISITVGDYFKRLYHEYEKKYSQKMPFKIVNYDPSNTNAAFKTIIEFSERPYPSILSSLKKFCNTTIRNISSNKSAYEEEDTDVSISTTDNQDFSYDNIVPGDSHPLVDDMWL